VTLRSDGRAVAAQQTNAVPSAIALKLRAIEHDTRQNRYVAAARAISLGMRP
jgi:hypothetical protein